MRRTHLHLAEPQLARLRVLAAGTGLNVAELVRRALDEFLAREDAGCGRTTNRDADPGPAARLTPTPEGP